MVHLSRRVTLVISVIDPSYSTALRTSTVLAVRESWTQSYKNLLSMVSLVSEIIFSTT